ncbi:hypothetical protein TIFTF001_014144 [Ficus carica]|uniref:Uncharacterized protein n=1 Tax=Ficus carica TaxID=3494 RepID=A0AA88D5C7_FICCA|nr:hypothetical protein TIFTF001_014144 [Ficus carica]
MKYIPGLTSRGPAGREVRPEARPGVGRKSARAVHAGGAGGGHVAALARLARIAAGKSGADT